MIYAHKYCEKSPPIGLINTILFTYILTQQFQLYNTVLSTVVIMFCINSLLLYGFQHWRTQYYKDVGSPQSNLWTQCNPNHVGYIIPPFSFMHIPNLVVTYNLLIYWRKKHPEFIFYWVTPDYSFMPMAIVEFLFHVILVLITGF